MPMNSAASFADSETRVDKKTKTQILPEHSFIRNDGARVVFSGKWIVPTIEHPEKWLYNGLGAIALWEMARDIAATLSNSALRSSQILYNDGIDIMKLDSSKKLKVSKKYESPLLPQNNSK